MKNSEVFEFTIIVWCSHLLCVGFTPRPVFVGWVLLAHFSSLAFVLRLVLFTHANIQTSITCDDKWEYQ